MLLHCLCQNIDIHQEDRLKVFSSFAPEAMACATVNARNDDLFEFHRNGGLQIGLIQGQLDIGQLALYRIIRTLHIGGIVVPVDIFRLLIAVPAANASDGLHTFHGRKTHLLVAQNLHTHQSSIDGVF